MPCWQTKASRAVIGAAGVQSQTHACVAWWESTCGGCCQSHAASGQVALPACLNGHAQPIAPDHHLQQHERLTRALLLSSVHICSARRIIHLPEALLLLLPGISAQHRVKRNMQFLTPPVLTAAESI